MSAANAIDCPAAIEFLLHCYSNPEPFERIGSPFHAGLSARWLREGVIVECAGTVNYFRTTDLGEAWVRALCNVKKPTSVYVDEHGTILK